MIIFLDEAEPRESASFLFSILGRRAGLFFRFARCVYRRRIAVETHDRARMRLSRSLRLVGLACLVALSSAQTSISEQKRGSCVAACGSCWFASNDASVVECCCEPSCVEAGDCCEDYRDVCVEETLADAPAKAPGPTVAPDYDYLDEGDEPEGKSLDAPEETTPPKLTTIPLPLTPPTTATTKETSPPPPREPPAKTSSTDETSTTTQETFPPPPQKQPPPPPREFPPPPQQPPPVVSPPPPLDPPGPLLPPPPQGSLLSPPPIPSSQDDRPAALIDVSGGAGGVLPTEDFWRAVAATLGLDLRGEPLPREDDDLRSTDSALEGLLETEVDELDQDVDNENGDLPQSDSVPIGGDDDVRPSTGRDKIIPLITPSALSENAFCLNKTEPSYYAAEYKCSCDCAGCDCRRYYACWDCLPDETDGNKVKCFSQANYLCQSGDFSFFNEKRQVCAWEQPRPLPFGCPPRPPGPPIPPGPPLPPKAPA